MGGFDHSLHYALRFWCVSPLAPFHDAVNLFKTLSKSQIRIVQSAIDRKLLLHHNQPDFFPTC